MKRLVLLVITLVLTITMLPIGMTAYADELCKHNWSGWILTENADCAFTGEMYRWCSKCGEKEWKTIPRKPHSWSDWEIIEYADCETTGKMCRWCSKCGEEDYKTIPREPHDWGRWKTVRKSTGYVQGKAEHKCRNCGEHRSKKLPLRKLTTREKKVRAVVNKYLNAAKYYKVKKMNSCFATKSNSYGYPTAKYHTVFKRHNKKIKWKIKNITGSKRKYTVKVSVTRPDFYKPAYKAMYNTLWWAWDKWGWDMESSSHNDQLATHYGVVYKKQVRKYKNEKDTRTISFIVIKTRKGWRIKKKTKGLVDIATAFLHDGQDDALDDWAVDFEDTYY